MIGNDIIDLALARKHIRATEKRYWKKALTEEEISCLEKQADPVLAFHTYWAAKEATFKLISKQHPAYTFSPKKIIIKHLPALSTECSGYGEAETIYGTFTLYLKINPQTIEVFASENKRSLQEAHFQSFPLPGTSYSTQSSHTQDQLKKAIATFLSIDIEKLQIQKENSIPKLYISQKKTSIDISLSHHGNWGAFGYLS